MGKELLLKYPNRPYTAFHTRNGKIPLWKSHLERLKTAARNINIEERVAEQMKLISGDVSMILVVVDDELFISIEPFQIPKLEPCQVFIYGSPRKNPTMKNTSWFQDRRYIEQKRPVNVTEMLLSKNGFIYEGLVTNFFALVDDVLITAPFDSVLPGTVAQSVISLCTKHNYSFRFEFPHLSHGIWKGAFLTNANRWIHPVKSIRDEQGNGIEFEDFEFILHLQTLLTNTLLQEAIQL